MVFFNGFWSENHWYQWFFNGFVVWQPLDTMVFQWFSMVANHWSDNGMVTIHRSGLTWTDLNENRGNWILLGWTRSALVVFVHERNAYCSCSFLGTLVRITKVGIFSDDRGLDWLEWDTGIEVARSCIFVIASPFSDQIGEHYLFWRHFIIGLHFL